MNRRNFLPALAGLLALVLALAGCTAGTGFPSAQPSSTLPTAATSAAQPRAGQAYLLNRVDGAAVTLDVVDGNGNVTGTLNYTNYRPVVSTELDRTGGAEIWAGEQVHYWMVGTPPVEGTNTQWALVSPLGELLTQPLYLDIQPIDENTFLARRKLDAFDILDKTGAVVGNVAGDESLSMRATGGNIYLSCDSSVTVTWGERATQVKAGVAYFASTGELLMEGLEEGASFSNGLCAVKQDGLWGFIDAAGQMVIAPQYTGADAFSAKGLCAVTGQDNLQFLIDATGQTVSGSAQLIQVDDGDVLRIVPAGQTKWCYADAQLTPLCALTFDSLYPFVYGMGIGYNDANGYTISQLLDASGAGVDLSDKQPISILGQGAVLASDEGGRYGICDPTTAAWVLPETFDNILQIGEVGALAYRADASGAVKLGFVSNELVMAAPLQYDSILYYNGVAFIVEEGGVQKLVPAQIAVG